MSKNLDNLRFHINRGGGWQTVSFSDLSEKEMDDVLEHRDEAALRIWCKELGMSLKRVGNAAGKVIDFEAALASDEATKVA